MDELYVLILFETFDQQWLYLDFQTKQQLLQHNNQIVEKFIQKASATVAEKRCEPFSELALEVIGRSPNMELEAFRDGFSGWINSQQNIL
jgi:hypothetical protein